MKYLLYSSIPSVKVKRIIPNQFLGKLPKEFDEGFYTILVFTGPKDSVVLSSVVQKAIDDKRLDLSNVSLMAFGRDFTIEAVNLFKQHGIIYYTLTEILFWTDQRYIEIKNGNI